MRKDEREAFRYVIRALDAVLAYDAQVARNSLSAWVDGRFTFNDAVWRQGNYEWYERHAEARKALLAGRAALKKASHPTPGPTHDR